MVREGGLTGTLITDNEAVGGLRDFGQVGVGISSATLVIGLTNTSANPITISATKSGANPNDFYIINFPSVTLPANSSDIMEVVFYTTTAGVHTSTIELAHNAAYSGTTPFEINLRGEAIVLTPIIQVDQTTSGGTNIPHQNAATGTPRDFGSVDIGNSSAVIAITNTGTGNLTVTGINMGGTWWNQYAVSGGAMPVNLAPSASMTFTVAFQPTSIGVKNAHVRIYHNGTAGPTPYEVPVLGNATAAVPLIAVSDGVVILHDDAAAGNRDFGNLQVGNSSTPLIITITNSGSSALNVGTPALGGVGASHYILDLTNFASPVAAFSSTTFDIIFSPTATGAHDATVEFTHDDATVTSPFIVNITGAGTGTGDDDDDEDDAGCALAAGTMALPLLLPLLIAYRRRRRE